MQKNRLVEPISWGIFTLTYLVLGLLPLSGVMFAISLLAVSALFVFLSCHFVSMHPLQERRKGALLRLSWGIIFTLSIGVIFFSVYPYDNGSVGWFIFTAAMIGMGHAVALLSLITIWVGKSHYGN